MTRLLLPLAAAAALAAGCGGGPDVRKTFPVAGTLTINGAPAEPGIIVFLHPLFTETDKYPIHPRALTTQGGSFQFTTYNADDGVPEGEYVATLQWPPPALLSSYASGDLFGGAFGKADVNKSNPDFKVIVTKNGGKLDLKLTLTEAQQKAVEAGKQRAKKNAGGFNLSGQ